MKKLFLLSMLLISGGLFGMHPALHAMLGLKAPGQKDSSGDESEKAGSAAQHGDKSDEQNHGGLAQYLKDNQDNPELQQQALKAAHDCAAFNTAQHGDKSKAPKEMPDGWTEGKQVNRQVVEKLNSGKGKGKKNKHGKKHHKSHKSKKAEADPKLQELRAIRALLEKQGEFLHQIALMAKVSALSANENDRLNNFYGENMECRLQFLINKMGPVVPDNKEKPENS